MSNPRKKGTVEVCADILRSPGKSYINSESTICQVDAEITPDSANFMPTPIHEDSPWVKLFASISDRISMNHRATAVIDCGIKLNLPKNFRLVVAPSDTNIQRGLLTNLVTNTDGRVRISVTNIGKEIIALNPGDEFAKMTAEPAFFFR